MLLFFHTGISLFIEECGLFLHFNKEYALMSRFINYIIVYFIFIIHYMIKSNFSSILGRRVVYQYCRLASNDYYFLR